MKLALTAAMLCLFTVGLRADRPPLVPYNAIEVDPFGANPEVGMPPAYETAIADDIAREASVEYRTVMILRPGDPPPTGARVLRITGRVTRFTPGNRTKRLLVPFAGTASIEALVQFSDAATGQLLFNGEFKGAASAGAQKGAESAGDGLAKKIVKLCNSAHLIASN